MTFPLTLAAALLLIAAFTGSLIGIAGTGTRKAVAHRNLLRDATPAHTYTRDDGTEGNWP